MKKVLLLSVILLATITCFSQTKSFCVQASCKQTISSPQDSALIFGLVTASDGVRTQSWIQLSGPTQSVIVTPGATQTMLRKLAVGTYIYNFTGISLTGTTGSVQDTVVVMAPTIRIKSVLITYQSSTGADSTTLVH